MKISEALKSAALQLSRAGIADTANLDAMIILETVLEKKREYLISHSDELLSAGDENNFFQLLKRRLNREPISHITGVKEFYGREFKISNDVLTPRPETEFIIEAALELYPRMAEINVLDLGTGSGCIILTLLAEFVKAHGTGVDISNSALAIAKRNAYNLGVANVEFVVSDWCKNLTQKKFNLIVSNPPYIARSDKVNLAAELGYEPEMALFGGDDGLECYRKLAGEISKLEFDFAIFEIGINQDNEIKKIFAEYQMQVKEIKKDLAGISRVMIFTKTNNK